MEQLVFLMPALAFFMMYSFLKLERGLAEATHILWIFLIIALQFHKTLGF
jgi:intracellular septation protein A